MNSMHLAIIAAFVLALMVFVTGESEKDMAEFQRKIRPDYQAYTPEVK